MKHQDQKHHSQSLFCQAQTDTNLDLLIHLPSKYGNRSQATLLSLLTIHMFLILSVTGLVFGPGTTNSQGGTLAETAFNGIVAKIGTYTRYIVAGDLGTVQSYDFTPSKKGEIVTWTAYGFSSCPFNSATFPFTKLSLFMSPDLIFVMDQQYVALVKLAPGASDTFTIAYANPSATYSEFWGGLAMPSTSYAYIMRLPTAASSQLSRFDSGTHILVQGPSTQTGISKALLSLQGKLVSGGLTPAITFYDVPTLAQSYTVAWPSQVDYSLVDNLSQNTALFSNGVQISGSYGVSRVQFESQVVLEAQTSVSILNPISGLSHLGTFNLILVAVTGSNNGMIFSKNTLAMVENFIFSYGGCGANCWPTFGSLTYTQMTSSVQVQLAFQATSQGVHFRSLSLVSPVCSTTSGSLCTGCLASYFLLPASGQCYSASDIPDGYGVSTGSLLAACSVSGCKQCHASSSSCSKCVLDFSYKSTQVFALQTICLAMDP